MVREAVLENVDCCVLISGDADFVPAFGLIKDSGKGVLSASVPGGYSNELRQKFPSLVLGREKLSRCLRDYCDIGKKKEDKLSRINNSLKN